MTTIRQTARTPRDSDKTTAPAKISRPGAKGTVPRPRLFRLLDRSANSRVTWICGPPGAGKSSLVASYVEARHLACLWYRLDTGDDDVGSFFHYLRLAAGQSRIKTPLPVFSPEYVANIPAFAQRFFRILYGRFRVPFLFVFDDYQQVRLDSAVHDVMRVALGEVPVGGRVVVVSRREPPAAFARLLANRAIAVVDDSELRLTEAEARMLCTKLAGRLPAQTVRSLSEAAEGWAAGLVLMLQEHKHRAVVTARRPRPPGAMFDYFAGEVFERTDAETRDVLLQTAFLPRATGRMAEDLTGLASASRILGRLQRDNYFTTDDRHAEPTYHFHPLFREFLMKRAQSEFSVARRQAIQQAGARLLERAGQIEDAAELLRTAEDWDGLGRLVVGRGGDLCAQGRYRTLQGWISALPPERVTQDAWLLFWQGVSRLPITPRDSLAPFEQALARFRAAGDAAGSFLAWASAVDSIVFAMEDYRLFDGYIAVLPELRRQFPTYPSRNIHGRVAMSMIFALVGRSPAHPEFAEWAETARSFAADAADVNARIHGSLILLLHDGWSGNFRRAAPEAETLRVMLESAEPSVLQRFLGVVAIARVEWLTGAFSSARKTIQAALELAHANGMEVWVTNFIGDTVAVALCQGDLETAETTLAQHAARTRGANRPLDRGYYHFLAAWNALLRGDLAAADDHQRLALELATRVGFVATECLARLLSAQVSQECGRFAESDHHVGEALALARRTGSRIMVFMGLLSQAHAAFSRGQHEAALLTLRCAMPLGREEGYRNTWLWRPSMMAGLCVQALEAGIEVEYVKQLVRERGLVPDVLPLELREWPWAVEVVTLGGLEVRRGGEAIKFSHKAQRKPLALLLALVVFGGQQVVEHRLMDALWPESDGDAAVLALKTTLHRLRRLLGTDEAVQRGRGRVSLDPRYCWVDVWALDRILRRAETGLMTAHGDDQRKNDVETTVETALNLYRGDFAAGESEEVWITDFADRLRHRVRGIVGRVGERCEKRGDHARALAWCDKATAIARLSEARDD